MAEGGVELQDIPREQEFRKSLSRSSIERAKSGKHEEEAADRKTIEFNSDKFFGQTRLAEADKEDTRDNDSDAIIQMRNVHKTYLLGVEGVPALRGVSLTIKRGEFVVVFGTSGGGKTTLLNICGTIDKPTKGELILCGCRINDKTKDADLSDIRLNKIGFVFQTFNLLSALTAQENVEMPMILNGTLNAKERKQRAAALLDMVGLKHRLDHVPSQLSGGEQQRTTIARAIANKPQLLLLDEPTGDLDTVNTLIVMKLLTKLNRDENITMLMVTHDVALKAFADRVIWMRDGKIQRIEEMPRGKKQEAIENLDVQLREIQKKRKEKARLKKERRMQEKERKKQGLPDTEDTPVLPTELRSPTDYTTHPDFRQRDTEFVETRPDLRKKLDKKLRKGEENGHSDSYDSSHLDVVVEKEARKDAGARNGKVIDFGSEEEAIV